MKKLFLILGVLLSKTCISQVTEAINAIDISKSGLTKTQSELLFQAIKKVPNGTELSIAFIKNEKVSFLGVKRSDDVIVLAENHEKVFEIGSITKVFTATLLSNLVIENKVDLDDDIRKHLGFNLKTNEVISFKNLANHTSGLPRLPSNLNMFSVDINNPYKTYTAKDLEVYLKNDIELIHKPNTKFLYSNLGAGLLGYLVAGIYDKPFENVLEDKVLKKYNMINSTSIKSNVKKQLIAGLNTKGEQTSNWEFDALAGAGAMFSTTEDLSKFTLAQFNANNKELALTHKAGFEVNKNIARGLGWSIITRKDDKGKLLWHNGATGGYSSSMLLDVERNNAVIILSNVSGLSKEQLISNLNFQLFKMIE